MPRPSRASTIYYAVAFGIWSMTFGISLLVVRTNASVA
jgi:hypothetical protein